MPSNLYRDCPPASLFKQFAAMLYDSLLIFAVLFAATALALLFNQGQAIESSPLFNLYLILTLFTFYAWFWHKSGQTLGMRAWRIMLVDNDGGPVGLRQALLRLASAALSWIALGLGFLWSLLDRDRLAWHDRLSRTRLVLLKKPSMRPPKQPHNAGETQHPGQQSG